MRIGIFGGSFDPVHAGHVGIARRAIAEFKLDRLLVIPAAVSPFKTDRAPRALGYDRVELLRAAFADIPEAIVDTRELTRGGVSYSVVTVREIAAENPGAEIIFLVGEDSYEGLPRWKNYDELLTLCTFKSFPRTKESSTEVRRRLLANEPVDDLLPPAVTALIKVER